jgi:predicted nucleic acid-binding Zn ribbon protein
MSVIPKPFSNYKLGAPRKNARDSVLDQWRGMGFTTLEKTAAVRARKAGDVLPHVLKEMRMDRRRSEAEVVKVWNELIDPGIVAHAQPTGLNKGTLFVTVDSSPWLDEIVRYRRKEILNRLQHSFGTDFVTRISFRLG